MLSLVRFGGDNFNFPRLALRVIEQSCFFRYFAIISKGFIIFRKVFRKSRNKITNRRFLSLKNYKPESERLIFVYRICRLI